MKGNPGHGNGIATRLAARGESDVQQLGSLLGVLVEQLVEVAHAVEHQLIRMLALELPVLLHHRGVFGQVLNVFGHRFSGLRRWGRPGWIETVWAMEGNVHQPPVDHPPWAAGGAAGCLWWAKVNTGYRQPAADAVSLGQKWRP